MQAEFRNGDDRPHEVQEVSSGAAIRTFITRHCNILISIHYRVRTLTPHNTEESENTPESPYLGEIKRMRKLVSCPAYFSHAEGKNSLVNGLFRLCSKRHVGGAPIRLLHENDVTYCINCDQRRLGG